MYARGTIENKWKQKQKEYDIYTIERAGQQKVRDETEVSNPREIKTPQFLVLKQETGTKQ